MSKIITEEKTKAVSQKVKSSNKSIVLVGGVFDILHIGHIRFLKAAKEKGDILIVLLESDESARKVKGESRPINCQLDRAELLSALDIVDFVVIMKGIKNSTQYDELVESINPDIIATTAGDKKIMHKQRQAKLVNAKLLTVIDKVVDRSTTRLAKIIHEENNL